MKIFISHSSKDKWAARRISQDLIAIGAETFLDEKDIQTGESIDTSIKDNLKSCDEFLIILSPASIKSEWVLIELGGALALEKNVVPILLYVGANELPKIINLRLARDINVIQTYYDEVKVKITGEDISTVIKPKPKPRRRTISKLKKGSIVRIPSKRPKDYEAERYTIDWEEDMDDFLGQITEITQVDEDGDFNLKIDNEENIWAKTWVKPA